LQCLKFTAAKFDSLVPGPSEHQGGPVSFTEPTTDEEKLDAAFVKDINELLDSYRSAMDSLKFRNGLIAAMALSARGNQYLQDNTLDNALLANHPERCAQVILNAINLIYTLSAVFHPFMPSTTDGILQQLNAPARSLPDVFSIDILPGHKIGKPDHLFKRIDPAMEVEWRNRFGGESTKNPGPAGVEGGVTGAGTAVGADVKATQGGLSKSALAKQKKAEQKAQSAALAALKEANKTPEVKALEEKMDKQKEVVKDLKTGKTQGDVDAEVAELLKMKTELTELLKALEASKISA
jgi:methionyl-tRNA synthetase